MDYIFYQDEYVYYIRKPHGIPTTFGKEESFLDHLEKLGKSDGLSTRFHQQQKIFGREEEYGLLNRLDNDTAGLLYFAKNHEAKKDYKNLQASGVLKKIYTAEVYGEVKPLFFRINHPIAHHKSNHDRMIILTEQSNPNEIGSKPQYGETYGEKISYNPISKTTTLRIIISKGIRHQIRAHLASIGHSIVGETIYIPSKLRKAVPQTFLHLRCLGLTTDNDDGSN